MKLEYKMLDPIILKLSESENVALIEGEKYPLEKGVMFGSTHYGFSLVVGDDDEATITEHGTQCRITGVQIVGSTLNIYEEHKYIPWRFECTSGELVNRATFSYLKKSEKAYLEETYGITDEEGLDEINDEKTI